MPTMDLRGLDTALLEGELPSTKSSTAITVLNGLAMTTLPTLVPDLRK